MVSLSIGSLGMCLIDKRGYYKKMSPGTAVRHLTTTAAIQPNKFLPIRRWIVAYRGCVASYLRIFGNLQARVKSTTVIHNIAFREPPLMLLNRSKRSMDSKAWGKSSCMDYTFELS